MAGDIPPLNIDIQVALGNLTSAVDQATVGLNKIGDTAKNQESKFLSLKTVMAGVFGGNLMMQGAQMLEGGLRDAIKAIQDTQVATEQLSTALNDAKQNTAANRTEIQATTEKMSALGFSTSATEGAYKTLISATGSTTEATKLMAMAADLARYKHEDLATAAMTLEKGTMGNARAFKEFGITLDTTLPKNQAITKAMDELNQKIGGQAIGYTHTFAGEIEVLKAKFDDVAVKVGAVVIPILTKLMEFITGVLIPAIVWLYNIAIGDWIKQLVNLWNTHEGLRKVVVDVIKAIVDALGYIVGAIGKVVDAASHLPLIGSHFKGIGAGIDEAAKKIGDFGKGLDALANKKIGGGASLADQLATAGTTGAGGDTGVTGNLGAAGNVSKAHAAAAKATATALAKRNAEIKKYNDEAVKLEDQMNAVLTDRQQKMDAATATRDDALAKANETYNQSVADINQKYDDAMATAQDNYNTAVENATATHQENLLNIQQQYADKAAQLEQSAADKRQSIIQQSIDVMTNAFASATKIDIGTLFTTGGTPSILSQSTVNGITTTVVGAATGTADSLKSALQSKLADILKLQKDAGDLAAKGYNQSFIDEVIAQGPAQGDALAQSVLNATPDTQNSIKSLYAQIQDTSQNGLNTLAAQMNDGASFATQALAQQYAQVGIDLQTQLAANSSAMQTAMDKENDTFNKSLTTAQDTLNKATKAATDARDLALQKAQDTLQNSITAAQDAFSKSVTAISDSTMKQLDALQSELEATAASLTSLGASTASISSYGASGGLTPTPTFNAAPSLRNQPYGPGIPNPVIGSLTQNVYTTDPSLPSLSTALTTAITLGQTQGIIPASAVVSNYASSGTSMRRGD